MREQVYTWLAQYLSSREENSKDGKLTLDHVKRLLKYENATLFLLIWPIMEQNIFDGYMRKSDIDKAAKRFVSSYQRLDMNEMFLHFYQRYQDETAFQRLKHNDTDDEFDGILEKQEDQITDKEKIAFLFYVVYRYRNNIFHGNKGIEEWNRYTEQITYCIQFMTKIIDCQIEMKETAK